MEIDIINKIKRTGINILWNKICKLIIILLFLYQSIDLTINYCKYETVINVEYKSNDYNSPAITICSDKNFGKIGEINVFKTIANNMSKTLNCNNLLNKFPFNSYKTCHQTSETIISINTIGNLCLTFLSQLINASLVENAFHQIKIEYYNQKLIYNKNIYYYIHRANSPPHFLNQYFKLKLGDMNLIKTNILNHYLLPFPYQTDCRYYMISNYKNEPKSQNDCFMKYLQKKEFEKCKCNRKWFYSKLIDFNITLCEKKLCEIKTNKVFLNKICKKDCFNEYYRNKMIFKDSINGCNNQFVNPALLLLKNL